MTKNQLFEYIQENFRTSADFPWEKYPEYAVFRHKHNKKWFALFMPIDGKKLSAKLSGKTDTITLKCDPNLREALLQKAGVYEAYHMNKVHWLTVDISTASEEDLKTLLEISFTLTEK